ncbi:hypothetical protein L210DRAFT_2477868 [Boletus edulis BED1]|uniref:Uncharacterized protein n=1 Tax=Boletus edulis BED1 TaxID=1328754 RepID=A0AAD4BQ00_BOLED|nr:hypothetical protein L210DRAFT_2477868 [Boletus edulis BED1]
MLPTRTKKRASPETDATHDLPGSDQSKRAKVEAFRLLDCTRKSGESEMHTIDSTYTPTSSCRSPSKSVVEIPSTPLVSSPDRGQMDVEDTSALLHFTSPPRSDFPFTSPPSPLTPLPSSPPTECLPEMQSLLAKKVNGKLLAFGDTQGKIIYTDSPGSLVITPMASTTRDVFQPSVHVPSRPSSSAVSTPRPTSAISGSPATSQSRPTRSPLYSANSMELMSPPAAPQKKDDSESAVAVSGSSSQPKDASWNNSDVDLSWKPSSRPDPNAMPISRPSIIEAMKPKRGPSVQQKAKRLTRSVSMKEQRVKGERAEIEATTTEVPLATTNPVAGPSSVIVSKPRLSKSAGVMTAKSKPPLIAQSSASVLTLPPDSSKLRQASLSMFVKAKPSTTGGIVTTGGSGASTSTGTGGPSRVAPFSSPSKIPLPVSPLNRLSTSQSRGTARRSLATLSHALDKLAAPPPSRPNSSMGFLREGGTSEDGSLENDSKGKGKAKDDASLPVAPTAQRTRTSFARHTASSLKRAATVMGFGSAARMRGRGGVGGIFGKHGDAASKKTRLPVVMGSPVKGRGAHVNIGLG